MSSRSVNYASRSLNDASRSINDASRGIIDDYRVSIQIVASLTIIIYHCNIFIVQATGANLTYSSAD